MSSLEDRNSEQNGPNLPIKEQCVPFTDRNLEQNSPNLPIWVSMFHLQIGTWNKIFLSCTRVNVLFLPCKKAGPLIVNRNTKTRNSRY